MALHVPTQPRQILTSNPRNVEYILKTNFQNYPKGELANFIFKDFLGDGIFNSDGELWHSQRKTTSFEFNKRSLRNFVTETVTFEILYRLIPLLDVTVEKETVLDLQDVLQRFAFDNICKVAFDFDPATLSEVRVDQNIPEKFMTAFDDSAELITGRFLEPAIFFWRIKRFLNIGKERRLKESIKVVNEFALDIIRSKKSNQHATPSCSNDILSRFTAKEDSTEPFLRDVIFNFLIAGRQTTSTALTWFFWLLSSNPDVELKILQEIRSIKRYANDDNGMFDFDQLREMNYLHAAISESLRLYPPVYIDTQTAASNDVLPDGTHVKKGTFVSYCAYAMGRTESIWGSDYHEFKPERWLVDGVFQPQSPFKFTVFHAGPRTCLGKEMAYIQMKSIVACFLDKFEYSVEKQSPPEVVLSITLRMKGGLPVRIKKRGDATP